MLICNVLIFSLLVENQYANWSSTLIVMIGFTISLLFTFAYRGKIGKYMLIANSIFVLKVVLLQQGFVSIFTQDRYWQTMVIFLIVAMWAPAILYIRDKVSFDQVVHQKQMQLTYILMLIFTIHLIKQSLLDGIFYLLPGTALFTPMSFIILLIVANQSSFVVGIVQRIFVLFTMSWLILAAFKLKILINKPTYR